MAKRKRVRFVFGLLAVVLIMFTLEVRFQAQQQDQPTYGTLKPDELLIINADGDVTVPFSLRNGAYGKYTPFALSPKQRRIYNNTTEILLKTDNGNYVCYSLQYGNRYEIYWSPNRNRWDLTRIAN